MLIPLDGSGPLYAQIYRSIRDGIHDGRLAAGDRLPPTRTLAERLDVSRTVVLEAYRQLRTEGYVEARVGSGTYVADLEADRLARLDPPADDTPAPEPARPVWSSLVERLPDHDVPFPVTDRAKEGAIDLRVGRLSEADFPARSWGRLLARHGRRTPPDYGDHRGDPSLRARIAAYLERSRGVGSDPDHVVVTAGARQAFDLLARLLLEEGDAVAVEEPCYSDARACFTATGARAVPVPVDERGLRVDRLPRGNDEVKVAYVTPSHQFPTGGVLPVGRRTELLRWAEEEDAFVVEDDYDSEFQFDVRPVPALKALDGGGRVLYVGTFAKVLSPDLRLGYVVLPDPAVGPFLALKRMSDRQCPIFLQRAVAEFMEEEGFERHLRRSRKRHGERRRALVAAVERHLPDAEIAGSEAGLHVLLRLPGLPPDASRELARRAAGAGILLFTADEHYLERPETAELLLGYAALEEEAIREGIERLAAVVDRVSAAPPPRS